MLHIGQMHESTATVPGARRDPGHELRVWMVENDYSVKELAARLGCQRPHLSRLLHRKGKPGRALSILIEELTNGRVAGQDWDA